jgi:hypothetical protein
MTVWKAAPTDFQTALICSKRELEYWKAELTQREWLTLMDILARYIASELGEDE